MQTRYLIDGYNLIHALGLLPSRVGPGGLERARLALVGLLGGALGNQASGVTIVFDAAHAPPGVPATQELHGIHIEYATGGKEADDLIEEILARADAPRQLSVVSDDHRVQQAARRRQSAAMKCSELLDLLQQQRHRPAASAASPEKQQTLSGSELAHWLHEFGNLQDDPQFRDLFEKYGLERLDSPET